MVPTVARVLELNLLDLKIFCVDGAIGDRLRSGFDVVIHCRGGLGRAGTIAARLLVELGMRPDEAVHRVRDARGPGAIETPAQEAHLMGCVPRAPADPSRTTESIQNRALGAFLGLAVGDAVGTTLEFSPRAAQPRLVDMVGGGPFELTPGAWTTIRRWRWRSPTAWRRPRPSTVGT